MGVSKNICMELYTHIFFFNRIIYLIYNIYIYLCEFDIIFIVQITI